MEFLIQQKMEPFRLDPDPADWQAIHDRLHKKKRRRFFWWILPIAGALLLGGAYFSMKEEKDQNSSIPAINPAKASLDSNHANSLKNDVPISNKLISNTSINHSDTQQTSVITPVTTPSHKSNKNQRTVPLKQNVPNNKTLRLSETKEQLEEEAAFPEQVNNYRYRSMPGVQKMISTNQASVFERKENPAPDNAKKIPNTNTHKNKGWYLGGYGGIGIHNAVDPISMAKAYDALPNTGSSGTSYFYQGNAYKNTGLHYDAGLILQKKNKKFDLSFGLGIQHNSWRQGYTLYKDSILSTGSLYSRAAVATKASTYQSFALEIPVMTGFRLGGQKNSSFWFNFGLNNAFLLSFREKNVISGSSPTYLSSGSRDSSLTAQSNTYQPQLRTGFTYEHAAKKYHWQASPYLQYGLRNMMQQGEPDVHILNLGIQFRYFFKQIH